MPASGIPRSAFTISFAHGGDKFAKITGLIVPGNGFGRCAVSSDNDS
jgi:hypothetical protein